MASRVKDIDKGWKQFVRDMGRINGSYVKVGFPEGFDPGQPSKGDGNVRDASEILVIGATHEFGTDRAGKNHNVTIPERSFLRSSFDEDKERNSRVIEKAYHSILSRRATVAQALGLVGLFVGGRVKKKLRDLRMPPLAPSTLRKRRGGSDNPLVDTGQLVNSIQHEVVVK